MNAFISKKITPLALATFVNCAILAASLISLAGGPAMAFGATGPGTGSLVPCNGPDCDFNSLLQLIKNVMYFLIYISIPIAAVAFAWAGFLFMTAGGNAGQVGKAWGIFRKVGTGLVVILAAWLAVQAITSVLLKDEFSPLK